ncbi:MAG: hypothetical protein GY756_12385 [bacterium]|nr:hypothetical protein [bacterium]
MDKLVNESIPCEGCCSTIATGTVYKIGKNSFFCESCFENAEQMFKKDHNMKFSGNDFNQGLLRIIEKDGQLTEELTNRLNELKQ